MAITKDTLISDILRNYSESIAIFDKYNMGCASCLGMQGESVEKACLMHGVDMEALLEELHKLEK